MVFEKRYDPKVKEKEIWKFWEENQIFKFDKDTKREVYSIDTPPPTISGKMHIGHAYSFSQQDFIARYKRMRGYEVYYPFGTDDNGLPTEKLVQKEKKVDLRKMSREEAIKVCIDYLKDAREEFIADWKNVGMSCDFDLCYSTIDDYSRKISQKSFLELASKGLVYRKEAPVIWDTKFQTAIAQAELEDLDKKSYFNDILFKSEDGEDLVISTTRPELLGACVGLFAHPDDKRYQNLFGKKAIVPIYGHKIPIIADESVEADKGSGLMMCCTFGDQKDIEKYKKHNLPLRMVIKKDGTMNDLAGNYKGLKIEDARKKIIEDLKDKGDLLEQKEIDHVVNVGERSGVPVEIINSKQWYVHYLNMKEDFLRSSEKLKWYPYFMKHRLDNWIKGLNWDWAIARQRDFGVPIPVWYCKSCGEVKFADEMQLPIDPRNEMPLGSCKCGSNDFEAEGDVFDTWFTSASSTFLAINLMEKENVYKKLFPMNLRPQAHDIINFWLFYTMAKTNILHNTNPWKDVIVSGFVLDPKGRKMSKSKGNVVAPQEVVEKYSADALRYAAGGTKLGSDVPYQEKEVQTGVKVTNKLYNANKFASMLLKDFTKEDREFKLNDLKSIDKWIVARMQKVIKVANEGFRDYDYSKARAEFELFFMRDVADNYIEFVKHRLWNPQDYAEATKSSQKALYYSLYGALRGLAPFMVFITEDIYQNFYKDYEDEISIHKTSYPQFEEEYFDEEVLEFGDKFAEIVSLVRKYKAENQFNMKEPISKLEIKCNNKAIKEFIEDSMIDLKAVTSAKNIDLSVDDKIQDLIEVRINK